MNIENMDTKIFFEVSDNYIKNVIVKLYASIGFHSFPMLYPILIGL
jgi:hypothetical protein